MTLTGANIVYSPLKYLPANNVTTFKTLGEALNKAITVNNCIIRDLKNLNKELLKLTERKLKHDYYERVH